MLKKKKQFTPFLDSQGIKYSGWTWEYESIIENFFFKYCFGEYDFIYQNIFFKLYFGHI